MPSDTKKPVRAAKAEALKNAVWLAQASNLGKQKRPRSSLSVDTLKAQTVGKMRVPKPKARPVAQDQAKAKGKAKAKPNAKQDEDASRLCHIPMVIADSDEDGLNEDGEDIDPSQGKGSRDKGGSLTGSDGEHLSDNERDDIITLDPRAVRARFKAEGADWGMVDVEDGSVPKKFPISSNEDEEVSEDDNPVSAKPIGKRAANRLAEVPQWEERPADFPTTCTDSGTPLSSGEEGDTEIDEEKQVPTNRYTVNRGWPVACHYVPVGHGQSMISLRSQPQTLKMVARVAINTSIANLVFDDAYPPIDGHTNYLRLTLCRSSRFLNLAGYARRFDQDAEFGRAFGRVINGRISIFRGQTKRNAASRVEGHYHLFSGHFTAESVKSLLQFSNYIYPTKKGPNGQDLYQRSKPFAHPAIIAILRDTFFVTTRGGSFVARNCGRFKSSVPSRPSEREIPAAMLALIATSIHSALEDYGSGLFRKTDFNADMYEDIYHGHIKFLSHIREESIMKYHCLMAGLYEEASNVLVPGMTSVSNDAILQLDLAGMEE